MRLFEKGEVSFILLWVLNPIVILFYQNCTPTDLSSRTKVAVRTSDMTSMPSKGRGPASADNIVLPYHHSPRR